MNVPGLISRECEFHFMRECECARATGELNEGERTRQMYL